MLARVCHEVGNQLKEPVGVPTAARIANDGRAHLPRRLRDLELAQGLGAELGEVCLSWAQLDASSAARTAEIEELLDHSRHTLAARENSTEWFALAFGHRGL